MKIIFTISPKNSSFPILIINNQEISVVPRPPGQSYYDPYFPIQPADRQKGILEISGIIRGRANTRLELTIDAYLNGDSKPPNKINIPGTYSNKGSFIFITQVSLAKGSNGFQWKRIVR